MSTAPRFNEHLDYLPLTLSLSDFETKVFIRGRAGVARPIPGNNRPAPAAARLTAPGLNERIDCPGGGAGFRIAARVATEESAKTALVNHLSLKSSRARGAGRVVSSVRPIPF